MFGHGQMIGGGPGIQGGPSEDGCGLRVNDGISLEIGLGGSEVVSDAVRGDGLPSRSIRGSNGGIGGAGAGGVVGSGGPIGGWRLRIGSAAGDEKQSGAKDYSDVFEHGDILLKAGADSSTDGENVEELKRGSVTSGVPCVPPPKGGTPNVTRRPKRTQNLCRNGGEVCTNS